MTHSLELLPVAEQPPTPHGGVCPHLSLARRMTHADVGKALPELADEGSIVTLTETHLTSPIAGRE